jgi:hypothetical protein
MHRHRLTVAVSVFGVGCAGLLAALLGFQTTSADGQVSAAKAAVVTVTAGKPSELAFKLSKSSLIAAGPVTFEVTNKGVLTHDFNNGALVYASAGCSTCPPPGRRRAEQPGWGQPRRGRRTVRVWGHRGDHERRHVLLRIQDASATIASVVRMFLPIEAAFWSAERVTIVGSMIPALTRSSSSPVSTFRP